MGNKKNLAIGALLVAGAGYVAGLLTAPKSGKETRQDIKRTAQQAKTEAERRLKAAHTELSEVVDEATKLIDVSKGKVNAGLAKAREQAEGVRQKSREILSAIHEGEAEDRDLQKALDDVKKATTHLRKYLAKKAG